MAKKKPPQKGVAKTKIPCSIQLYSSNRKLEEVPLSLLSMARIAR